MGSDVPPPDTQPPLPASPGPVVAYAPDHRRRLHLATVLVAVVLAARSLSWAIAIALLFRFSGRSGGFIEVAIAGVGSLQVAFAAVRYSTTRFAIEPATSTAGPALVIESGLIFKKRRAVPVARIQNINISRDIAHRLFGVAEIKIETAAGADAEANLSALSLADAEALKSELLAHQQPRAAVVALPEGAEPLTSSPPLSPAAPPNTTVYAASVRDLLIAGATRTKIGAVIGGVLGAFYFLEDALGSALNRLLPGSPVKVVLQRIFNSNGSELLETILGGAALVLLALLAGWLLSIGSSLVQHWKFTLERSPDGKLTRRFGLLTVHDLAFPRKRLQRLTITAPVIQRKLGLCRVEARTAGSYLDKESAGTAMLYPIARADVLEALCAHVVDGFSPSQADWQKVSPIAVRRWALRNTVVLSIFLGAAAAWQSWWLLAGWPLLVLFAWFLARAEYRVTRYAIQGELVLFRDGVITRTTRVIPRRRVQVSRVTASPIQRYLGLANLKLSTAAELMGSDAEIPNLPRGVAEALQDRLARGQ